MLSFPLLPLSTCCARGHILTARPRIYRPRVQAGLFEAETIRGSPLDMHQFARVFGMTRVPGEGVDELVQKSDSRHIVVLRGGAAAAVYVYDSEGRPLSFEQVM